MHHRDVLFFIITFTFLFVIGWYNHKQEKKLAIVSLLIIAAYGIFCIFFFSVINT